MTDYLEDDGYEDDDYDEPGYDDDRRDDYREPSEPDFEAEEYYRYQSMPRLGRFRYDLRDFIWRHTWRWRMKLSARWLLLTGRATTEPDDYPPF